MEAKTHLSPYTLERLYPWILGIGIAAFSWPLPLPLKAAMARDLSNPVLSILAISVGFIAAALTMLLTASNLPVLDKFKTGRRFNDFIDFHWHSIVTGMWAALLTLIVIIACKVLDSTLKTLMFHLWLGSVVTAFSAFFRVVSLLRALFKL